MDVPLSAALPVPAAGSKAAGSCCHPGMHSWLQLLFDRAERAGSSRSQAGASLFEPHMISVLPWQQGWPGQGELPQEFLPEPITQCSWW